VPPTCNPGYSGGRDQEDGSLKAAQENCLRDPILKITITLHTHTHTHTYTHTGLVEWLKVETQSSSLNTARKKSK
jgi:hypothetical protein